MQTRSSSLAKLTKKCRATEVLRDLWVAGKIDATSDPEDVFEMHPEFEKYAQERFPLYFRKRMSEFENEGKLSSDLNPRNTAHRSLPAASPRKKAKTSSKVHTTEMEQTNVGVHLIVGESEFVPDFEFFTWRSGDLRERLTLIVELPSGLRIKSVYWGVLEDGETFEVVLNRAIELTDPNLTFKKWIDASKDNGGFDTSHPKYIAYARLLENRKISPVDIPKKKARFQLPFTVQSNAEVNIVKYKDSEERKLNTVLLFSDFISADDSYKLIKPEVTMEEV